MLTVHEDELLFMKRKHYSKLLIQTEEVELFFINDDEHREIVMANKCTKCIFTYMINRLLTISEKTIHNK